MTFFSKTKLKTNESCPLLLNRELQKSKKPALKSNDRSHLIKFSKIMFTFCWCSFNVFLTVCPSAKVACDDFVTCLAAPAMAKEIAFSTQI